MFNHQRQWFDNTWNEEAHAIFWEMGTGKSKFILDCAQALFLAGQIAALLIIAPRGAIPPWLDEQIPENMRADIPHRVTTWRSGKRLVFPYQRPGVMDIVLCNVESLRKRDKNFKLCHQLLSSRRCMMVIDESTRIKGPKALQSKNVLALGRGAPYRRIATGTPSPHSPLDLYTQFSFLDKNIIGHDSFWTFRRDYAILQDRWFGVRKVELVTGYKNQAKLHQRIAPHMSRVLLKDCTDIKEPIYLKHYVERTDQQEEYERALLKTGHIEMPEGHVTPTEPMTKLLRRQQILCGYVVTDDGVTVPVKSKRTEELMDYLENYDDKVVIWSKFTYNIREIAAELRTAYGERSVVEYYGETSDQQRSVNYDKFRRNDACRFFVSNSTGSRALTLIESNKAIFYSNDWDLEVRQQQEKRNLRAGQTGVVAYTDLLVDGSIDEYVLYALKNHLDLAKLILNDPPSGWVL